ncbi:hypothetical protein HRR83_007675 [Exophiala dermatitidis]|uniref:Spindle pole body component n=1 Tax=Exophiala dermatitidis TaxID=5970 RepID=A0AAN6IVC1_EXODE|nr:hypothetical protein HRR73_008956 [Exophiala dermatitidis]KAJ4509936.1 hypothetical protein HRR74_007088 [Exophiala dermatitidis]KAJ4539508.1 hypothetical protein HRR77_006391 [Exophiala dermatitidis]KAJ4548412.1 hypothetical protein HRR76_001013 [Exophiala dermatitidis]KAJ4562931.1 hypothetical protein HRR79_006525 [Exophiala dermatitidis]
MLHEILLSLSGFGSPLWSQARSVEDSDGDGFSQYTSPPERAMLDILARLCDLHVKIRDTAARLSTSHRSMVCRAVSSSIVDEHLCNFVDKIVEVESSILKKDAGYVGAYDVVPLSTIVSEFAPWTRRLEWLWSVVQRLIAKSSNARGQTFVSAAIVLDYLERETHTGYSDIEDMAIMLLTVAQKAWMRSASFWVLYGDLPTSDAEDFCVKANPSPTSALDAFSIDSSLTPRFLTPVAACALLSTGSALHQLRSQSSSSAVSLKGSVDSSMTLMPKHASLLQSLRFPISPPLLENLLASLDRSISENALSQILPRHSVMQILQVILRYVLLDHGEFAVSLVAHADERVNSRQQRRTATGPPRKIGRLDDLAIQEAELNGILSKTMADMATFHANDDLDDGIWALAKKTLSLKLAETTSEPQLISTLLPNPTGLFITIPPSSPLHIFLSTHDIHQYSVLNGYLLSIRRAGIHLSELWKLSYHRRCYPAPVGASRPGQTGPANRRVRDNSRTLRTRRHWTCAGKALFMINELQVYLQGEVIQSSWALFQKWINGEDTTGLSTAKSSRPGSASSAGGRQKAKSTMAELPSDSGSTTTHAQAPNDPRALAEAHRAFLHALSDALLITNKDFTSRLKHLLGQLDHFIALFLRLQTVWEGLDMQEDDGVLDAFADHARDEREVFAEMDRTTDAIESTLLEISETIRHVEKQKRSGLGRDTLVDRTNDLELNLDITKFVPWQARTVDRLVMKLDSLAGRHDEDDDGLGSGIVDVYDDD